MSLAVRAPHSMSVFTSSVLLNDRRGRARIATETSVVL